MRTVQQLASIFGGAGWKYEPGQMMMAFGPDPSRLRGLHLQAKTASPAPNAVLQLLAGIYGQDNIPVRNQNSTFEDGVIEITVWPK